MNDTNPDSQYAPPSATVARAGNPDDPAAIDLDHFHVQSADINPSSPTVGTRSDGHQEAADRFESSARDLTLSRCVTSSMSTLPLNR
jgi:hypothetical protein